MELIDKNKFKSGMLYVLNNEYYENKIMKTIMETFINIIERIPTIDAEPVVHAKWIKKSNGVCYWYVCSNCEGDVPHNDYEQWMFSEFCPYCGAKMDVEED